MNAENNKKGEQERSRPVASARVGRAECAIWAYERADGIRYSASFKSGYYRDASGQLRNLHSFDFSDEGKLETLRELVSAAEEALAGSQDQKARKAGARRAKASAKAL